MRKILIFGNSGSGKSTLAAALCRQEKLAHLDLDTLAWLPQRTPQSPPLRRPLKDSEQEILAFIGQHEGWLIEGCYSDLLAMAQPFANEAIFMNLPTALCQQNARRRPWEAHKYASKQAQDENLPMLLDWIARYHERDDVFSYRAHRAFFEQFPHTKREIRSNQATHSSEKA